MYTLTYHLRLLQPLLVSMLDPGDENASRSLNFVPGSVMRGALANRYFASRNLPNDEAAVDEQSRDLFFNNAVRFLDCMPADEDGKRTFPIPLAWFAEKDGLAEWNQTKDSGATLRVKDGARVDALSGLNDAKPIHAEAAFCQVGSDGEATLSSQLYQPKRESQTHIYRPHKRRNIDSKRERGVFTYESLAADQLFCGVVLVQTREQADVIHALLSEKNVLLLGRSRSAGYGQVQIESISKPQPGCHEMSILDVLTPVEMEDDNGVVSRYFVVTLLSDMLLRDGELGQFANDPSPALGIKPDDEGRTWSTCFRQMQALGGFNRKWRMPIVQVASLRAGSVFVYSADRVDVSRLRDALENGIGERLNDGFGRIAVNLHDGRDVIVRGAQSKRPELIGPGAVHPEQTDAIAGLILETVARRKMDQAVTEVAKSITIKRAPSNAMLSRVRIAARQSALSQSLQPLERFLQEVKGDGKSRKPAQVALEEACIKEISLEKWIRDRVDKRDVSAQLQLAAHQQRPMQLAGATMDLNGLPDELRSEFTARLIERVVKLAIKNNRKDGGR